MLAVAGGDNGVIGNVTIGDRGLHPAEPAVLDPGGDRLRCRCRRPFRQGKGADHLAGRDPRQQGPMAGQHQAFGEEIDGGGKGDGRQHPAQFFRHHAKFQMAEAEAAVGFRNGDAGPAHLGDAAPQRAVEGGLAFKNGADLLPAAAVGQETARLIAQQVLIVGKNRNSQGFPSGAGRLD